MRVWLVEIKLMANPRTESSEATEATEATIVTCLNRFLGRCKNCKRDYNPEHHPNNLDCPNYHPLGVLIGEVKGEGSS